MSISALIATKIEGKEIVTPGGEAQHKDTGNVINLMEALQKSIEQNRGEAGA